MNKLAELLFPNVKETVDDILKKYPSDNKVRTRFAPSPTGFLHIGGVYTALICKKIAEKENGIFYLRIEDTDKKREVEGSVNLITKLLNKFNIIPNEGINNEGPYKPYIQSQRVNIYHVFAKYLVEKGYAYPCFASEEDLENIRLTQQQNKENPGYYGKYALYRDKTYEEYQELLEKNKKFVLRFKVPDKIEERVSVDDLIKGHIEFENNYNDFVLLKENGIPTYHFAHAIDDSLMHTTYVIRGDEWLSSVPIHLQLFKALSFDTPKYAHVAPIMKLDGESRRKLSKRKDLEASAEYYLNEGYPIDSLHIYLLTLINSNFEGWYLENKDKDYNLFEVSFEHMAKSGALYDLDKLKNISSDIIYNDNDLYNNFLNWAKEYNKDLYNLVSTNLDELKNILNTQGENSHEKRKDLHFYNEFLSKFGYFYDDIYYNSNINYKEELKDIIDIDLCIKTIPLILENIDLPVKEINEKLGFVNKKKYDKDPSLYQGTNVQIFKLFRIVLTNSESGISLEDTMNILGKDKIIERFNYVLNKLK